MPIPGLEFDMPMAVNAAVEAALKAGEIMWECSQRRRATVAAAYAKTSLTAAPPLTAAAAGAGAVAGPAGANAINNGTTPPTTPAAPASTTPTSAAATASSAAAANPPPPSAGEMLGVETKESATDLVTRYDRMCDETVVRVLRRYCEAARRQQPSLPAFGFVTEELSPGGALGPGLTWVVDPIDGTMSFVHGLPDCSVSIGLAYDGEPVLAVIYCPFIMSPDAASLRQLLETVDAVHVSSVNNNNNGNNNNGNSSSGSNGAGAGGTAAAAAAHLLRRHSSGSGVNIGADSDGADGTSPLGGRAGGSPTPPAPRAAHEHGGGGAQSPTPTDAVLRTPSPPNAVGAKTPPPSSLRPNTAAAAAASQHNNNNNSSNSNSSNSYQQQQQQQRAAAAAAARGGGSIGLPECRGELLVAIKGEGCFLNGVPVRVRPAPANPDKGLFVWNLPYSVRRTAAEAAADEALLRAAATPELQEAARRRTVQHTRRAAAIDATMRIRRDLLSRMSPSVRLYGSSVTTLALVAAGRVSGYVEPASKAWDVCAGALAVTEAGGVVYNLYGEPFDMRRDTTIVAASDDATAGLLCGLCRRERLGQYWLLPDAQPESVVAGTLAGKKKKEEKQQQQQQQQLSSRGSSGGDPHHRHNNSSGNYNESNSNSNSNGGGGGGGGGLELPLSSLSPPPPSSIAGNTTARGPSGDTSPLAVKKQSTAMFPESRE